MTLPRRLPPDGAERLAVVVQRFLPGAMAGQTRHAQPVNSNRVKGAAPLAPPASSGGGFIGASSWEGYASPDVPGSGGGSNFGWQTRGTDQGDVSSISIVGGALHLAEGSYRLEGVTNAYSDVATRIYASPAVSRVPGTPAFWDVPSVPTWIGVGFWANFSQKWVAPAAGLTLIMRYYSNPATAGTTHVDGSIVVAREA
ncbi:MAG: hypothetical protein M3140_11190 [Actinomycetota bacterium]|nr:hypothetical protein [Actinomycetota bacterium]